MSGTEATPGIVAPSVRDLDTLSASLVAWLRDRMPGARDIVVTNLSYPLGAGMSHETILFDAAWQEAGEARSQGMVVRIKPLRDTVYCDDMFVPQYQLMQLMHESGKVRVARPLWFEEDDGLLGAPFFVLEKVAGRVAVSYPPYSKHGWLLDASPEERRRMWHDAVSQLASIQRVPTSQAGFLALPGGDGFDQEVNRWRRFIDWVDPQGKLTLLRDTHERMLAVGPANRPDGIVWGDSRLGNMMIGPDYRVAAVMDWEQPSLGGALHDLGWWLRSDHGQTTAQGIAPLDGMGTRDETIALWGEVCGKSTADIDWYEAYAGFKMECLAVRMGMIREMPAQYTPREPGSATAAYLDSR
ncbi:phosphotransferase family protein [Sphingomonas solaris]|uniref:Phosphotransferase family protein n=1 Tax=Alterirhizorhabdus solaris TaxID=2529389 RepID=A0A558RBA5_9SPHN|nr:phosphotransferase family protein [Sphingomonas solaris]TVV76654.1 phosphotransferase family protein [Sphingomonas solaris]